MNYIAHIKQTFSASDMAVDERMKQVERNYRISSLACKGENKIKEVNYDTIKKEIIEIIQNK